MKNSICIILLFVFCAFLPNKQDVELKTVAKKFIKDVRNRKVNEIFTYTKFPLFVECYFDGSKGDSINQGEFKYAFTKIFNDSIRCKFNLMNVSETQNISKNKFQLSIGFEKYSYDAEMIIEYAFVYSFEKFNKKWYLVKVNCR